MHARLFRRLKHRLTGCALAGKNGLATVRDGRQSEALPASLALVGLYLGTRRAQLGVGWQPCSPALPTRWGARCYRWYEAAAAGSIPILEERVQPAACASDPFALLKVGVFRNALPCLGLMRRNRRRRHPSST